MIKRLQITLLALFVSVLAMASETSVKNADGVEIWYDFDSSTKTASVTYAGKYSTSFSDEYTGEVVIPSKVTYEDKEYSVTEIGDYAFYECSSLTSITIPEGVTEIGYDAFRDCSSLTSITIPERVTKIEYSAFSGCSSLTSIDVALDNNSYTSIDGVLFSKDKTILLKYPEGKKDVTSYEIPEGVTSIKKYAFYDCSSLTSITIPKSVTWIGSNAFSNCSSLTSITIPEGVTEIGDCAFYECSSLTSITIPEGVTEIGSYAFLGCSTLTSITIPEGVTLIGSYAFDGCSSLTSIDVALDNNSYTSIDGVLFSKDKTILIQFPWGKKEVTSYAIPEGVTEIGSYAFEVCSTLTSITIPEGVTKIGEEAFYNCSGLTSITSMNVTPPSIDDIYAFDGVDKSIPVYVPKQSVEAYKSAEYWKDFTNIQGIDDTPISDVVADSVSIRLIGNSLIVEGAESYAVYALSGQCLGKVESLERGLYIVVADGVSKKIVVK